MSLLIGEQITGTVTRRYTIHVPDNPGAAVVPAIVVFHGGGQDAANVALRWGVDPPNPVPAYLANYLAVVSPTTANLRGIWGSTDGTLIAVGENGTTIASPQNLWSTEAPVTNAHLNRVSGTDLGNVWAVGESGTILTRTLN